MHPLRFGLLPFVATLLALNTAFAWDYEGHRTVSQLAVAALPPEFPAFVRDTAARERIAFLAGEPDRWRNVGDAALRHSGGAWTDHFIDLEQLPEAGLDPKQLPVLRYDFVVAFAAGRAAHADRFAPIDPAKNFDHSHEWPGFLPWAICEHYARLKSGFSYLKTFEELGTPDEVAQAKENILYVMGILAHYVGDGAQPLHTTVHSNGWIGDNPKGFSTRRTLHSWIDGGFNLKTGIPQAALLARVTPATLLLLTPANGDSRDPVFTQVVDYLLAQHAKVEPLYALEKRGGFPNVPDAPAGEGRAFIDAQLLTGSQMLASLYLTAWRSAPPDTYLRSQLIKRATANAPKTPTPKA